MQLYENSSRMKDMDMNGMSSMCLMRERKRESGNLDIFSVLKEADAARGAGALGPTVLGESARHIATTPLR